MFRWATTAFALVTSAFFLVLWAEVLDRTATVVVDDVTCALAPVAAGVLGLRRASRQSGRVRLGWALIGSSAIAWGLGGVTWAVYEVHLGVPLPYPSWADVGYLGSVPPLVVGLVLLGDLRGGWPANLLTVLDAALVATSLLFVSWATVLGPVVANSTGPALDRAVALAYPVSDVLTATLAVLAVAHARGPTRVVMGLLGTGLLVVAVSDSSFAWFVALGEYRTGNLFDSGYVAGYLLVGAAALHPDDEHLVETDDRTSALSLLLPYLPAIAGVGVLVAREWAGQPLYGVLFWLALAVFLLLVVRQLLSNRVNVLLQRRLRDSLAALRERERGLDYLAHHDGLTGLANRTGLVAVSRRLLQGPTPVPCGLLVIDMDGFKDVNDTYGHHTGDELLVAVARRLAASARQSDCVARLGGDEFAVLLADVRSGAETHTLADRIGHALDGPVRLAEGTVHIRASVGTAHSDDASDLATLLRRADLEMYQAKARRREPVPRPRPARASRRG